MSDDELQLPPMPERPDPEDCCGSGCMPCILDAYEQALEEWGETVARLRAEHAARQQNGKQ